MSLLVFSRCSCCCCGVLQLISSFASLTVNDMSCCCRCHLCVCVYLCFPSISLSLHCISVNMTCFMFLIWCNFRSNIDYSLCTFYFSFCLSLSLLFSLHLFISSVCKMLLLQWRGGRCNENYSVWRCLFLFIFHRRAPVIGSVVHE